MKFYQNHKNDFMQREEVTASHILLKATKEMSNKQVALKLEKARKVLKKAKEKGSNFAELAKVYSEGPSKRRGGSLGTFTRGGMVKAFEKAAFSAKPGQVIGPVKTQFGYHIIKIFNKKEEKLRSLKEVKEQIHEMLKQEHHTQKSHEAMDKLREEAKIVILDSNLLYDRKIKRPFAIKK